ncbi:uncharacterized protein LOC143282913 isoform X2 [Babylonia areolata]|uniref:uncharacterized protein LOC143282913 isoform X2 n=1 Tax=Babylonia areolata TaxID=304850 RepID=UPI003FD478B4
MDSSSHERGSSSSTAHARRSGNSRAGGGGGGGEGGGRTPSGMPSKASHHQQQQQQQPNASRGGGRPTSRTPAPKTPHQGEVSDKVTPAPAPPASFPLVSLKDVVSASRSSRGPAQPSAEGPHTGGGRGGGGQASATSQDGSRGESAAPRTNPRREKTDQRRHQQGGGTSAEADKSKKPPSSKSGHPSSSDRKTPAPASKTQPESKTKSGSNSSNTRAKGSSAETQDAAKTARSSPSRSKKSVGNETGTKDSSSKTPPRAKKKTPRGRTVHDSSEFGEVKEKQGNDLIITSQPPPSSHDLTSSSSKETSNTSSSQRTTAEVVSQRTGLSTVQQQQQQQQHQHMTSTQPIPPIFPKPPPPPTATSTTAAAAAATTTTKPSAFQVQLVPELSQQSSFFSLNKVPSHSSTSSDVQSEVCVDLPDYSEMPATGHDIIPEDLQEGGAGAGGGVPGDGRTLSLRFPSAPYRRLGRIGRRRPACLSALSTAAVLALSLLLFLPVLLLVLLLVPLCLFLKWLCSLCCCCGPLWGRCCIGCCHTHLTAPERLWVQKGADGGGGRLTPVAQCVIVLQRGLSTERLRHLLDARLLSLENRHGRRVYPRFTQRVEKFCCGYAWVPDHHFVLNSHVFNMPGYIESLEDLQDHIAKMASEPLSLDRPLWELQVLHNFREPRDTVLLLRLHLAVADGASMVRLLQHALVDTQKLTLPKPGFGVEAANMSPLKAFFLGPVTFCRRYLFVKNDLNLLHGQHVRACGEMAVAWSEPFSLSAAVRVKQVARCTLSELLVSVVAGNIRTYMQVSGVQHPYNIHCALPVDFRSDYSPSSATTTTTSTTTTTTNSPGMVTASTDVGNHYSLAVLPLATNTEGSIPRLWETKQTLERFKSSPEAAIVSGAQWFTCCVLPVTLFQRFWQRVYSRCTVLIANLAGPETALKLDSREIKCMMYWVPPLQQVAITISFLTYADQVRMAVISDRSVLPNPELLTRDFIYKLETVSKLLAHRRIPGEQLNHRMESAHLLSSYTLDDLSSEEIQLQMTLVQQELHDMKLQLDSGSSRRITANDTQLCHRIEQLKERSRELLMHFRKRRAAEAENAIILSEEDEAFDSDSERPGGRPFRRRTLSISSKMSTASVSSQMRPLSTASISNAPSPSHPFPPTWPDSGDESPFPPI